ncbi:hypothetical protein CEXT_591571 [Caerostris extrusa]|uniref:Uncharacterized protein n=1 Tax=Caerostris extrusa TaxID=172846 RepID=A0AAV4VYE0_CAEEX|nr:hypothetical protein CEXT_591571 [Caerostris extrusa]
MFSNDPSCPALMPLDEGSGTSELTTPRFVVPRHVTSPYAAPRKSAVSWPVHEGRQWLKSVPRTPGEPRNNRKKIKLFKTRSLSPPSLDICRRSTPRRAVISPVHEGACHGSKRSSSLVKRVLSFIKVSSIPSPAHSIPMLSQEYSFSERNAWNAYELATRRLRSTNSMQCFPHRDFYWA